MNYIWGVLLACLLLTACNNGSIKAPCPDFGAHCYKRSVNTWYEK